MCIYLQQNKKGEIKMKQISVMNRSAAHKYSFKPHEEKTAIISITDVNSHSVNFRNNNKNNIIAVLNVFFDDVLGNEVNCMNENDAERIAEFAKNVVDKVDKIIVHCEAGVSRSAGVAAALMKYFNGDDMPIFENPQYCPNMYCYRMVLGALMMEVNEEEIKEKENINIKVWKDFHGLE